MQSHFTKVNIIIFPKKDRYENKYFFTMEWGSFKKVQTKCYGHETEVIAKTLGELKNNSLLKSSLNKVWKSILNLLEKKKIFAQKNTSAKKKSAWT